MCNTPNFGFSAPAPSWLQLKKLWLWLYIFVNFVYSLNNQYENWEDVKIHQGNNTNSIFNFFGSVLLFVLFQSSDCTMFMSKSLQATQYCSERIRVETTVCHNYNYVFPKEYTRFCKAFFIFVWFMLHRNTI